MASRRNGITAVLFLLVLTIATSFLLCGTFPEETHFADLPRLTKTAVRATEDAAVPLRPSPPSVQTQLGATYRLAQANEDLDRFLEEAEPGLNALLDREHTFIELYGGIQQLTGRRMVEDVDPQYTVVRLDDHSLTFANPDGQAEDVTVRAEEMVEFARLVEEEYDIPLLYVQAPSKTDVSPLPDGVEDAAGREADQFLALLEKYDVATLDLRPVFRKAADSGDYAEDPLFFTTDHHWTPTGAFLGYRTLCERLAKDYRFKIDKKLTDPDSFHRYTFEDIFLGSQGRRVGSLYAGLDDLDLWSPTFPTDFTYTVPIVGIEREGPFIISLLFPERLAQQGYYDTNPYTIYSGDDYLLARAVNRNNPQGKRILILRDSFGCALTPFLSLISSECMAIDPRNFNGNQETMMEYLDWLEPDILIVMNTTGSIKVDELFPYLPTARANVLEAKRSEK